MDYLLIDEWGDLHVTNALTDDILQAHEAGVMDIIKVIDGHFHFYDGNDDWISVDEWRIADDDAD